MVGKVDTLSLLFDQVLMRLERVLVGLEVVRERLGRICWSLEAIHPLCVVVCAELVWCFDHIVIGIDINLDFLLVNCQMTHALYVGVGLIEMAAELEAVVLWGVSEHPLAHTV